MLVESLMQKVTLCKSITNTSISTYTYKHVTILISKTTMEIIGMESVISTLTQGEK